MTRKVLITFALIVFSVTIASAQTVGTYKATRAATVTERIPIARPPKPHNPLFLGVNAGINGTVGTIQSLDFTLGADIAFSKTEKFAWGFFTGYETVTKANYGLLFVHGNYVKGSAFFWGLGFSNIFKYKKTLEYEGVDYTRRYNGYRFLLRLGYKSESFLYYNVTLSAGSLNRTDHYTEWDGYYRGAEGFFGAAVTVGYRFNTKLKTN